ncbi:glycosyltransferase [Nioella aestuarii]|uniref:glycosyltransferase n=1 Tax=Nioella aestuarii TaxID=1662864 RepID=UPI003D7F6CA6
MTSGQTSGAMQKNHGSGRTGDTTGRITILMGLYDGAVHLKEQLDSFEDQTVSDWDLIVSDDGSQDSGPRMVERFAQAQRHKGRSVTLIAGQGRGFSANFLSMLANLPQGTQWAALSDQDDVWLPHRLELGQRMLSGIPEDRPALFGSATWIVEEDLSSRVPSPRFKRPPGFRNALVQSIAGGNTMLLNRAGVDLARAAAAKVLEADTVPVTHDWWLYQIISGAGGEVVRSEEPTLLYRQHGGNLHGSNRGVRASLYRLKQVFNGELARWTARNSRALRTCCDWLSPENQALQEQFASLRSLHMVSRIRSFRQMGLYRQGRVGQAVLWLAAALGRL